MISQCLGPTHVGSSLGKWSRIMALYLTEGRWDILEMLGGAKGGTFWPLEHQSPTWAPNKTRGRPNTMKTILHIHIYIYTYLNFSYFIFAWFLVFAYFFSFSFLFVHVRITGIVTRRPATFWNRWGPMWSRRWSISKPKTLVNGCKAGWW